jgi:hypothetical protein
VQRLGAADTPPKEPWRWSVARSPSLAPAGSSPPTIAANTGSRRVLEKAGLRNARTVHLDWPDPLPGNEHGDVECQLCRERRGSLSASAGPGRLGEGANLRVSDTTDTKPGGDRFVLE